MAQSQEYLKREFMHFISDTLALLGADEEIVRKVQGIEEKPFTSDIIEYIRQYNITEHERLKTRLCLLHTTSIEAKGK